MAFSNRDIVKLSLYDLQDIKEKGFCEVVNTEIQRRLNLDLLDEISSVIHNHPNLIIQYTKDLKLAYKLYSQKKLFNSIADNENITLEFLLLHPDLIKGRMMKNKAITIEFFIDHIDEYGRDEYFWFLRNPNLTKDFLLNYYTYVHLTSIDYTYVSHNNFVNYEFLRDHGRLITDNFTYYGGFKHYNILPSEFDLLFTENLNRKKGLINYLHNKNVRIEHIRRYLSEYPTLDMHLSAIQNSNINIEFMLEIINEPILFDKDEGYYVFFYLTRNPGISIQDILAHPEFPWDEEYINERLDVSQLILEDPKYSYKNNIHMNRNVSPLSLDRTTLNKGLSSGNLYYYDPEYRKLAQSILDM